MKQIIEPHVDQTMDDANIVGLTVAVTRKNKLLLGYKANSGEDLSNVHVAVASNTQISTSHLSTLASRIAKAVSNANIPASYKANVLIKSSITHQTPANLPDE